MIKLERVLHFLFVYPESLRLLSLHDNKYLRYFKGHHDRHSSLTIGFCWTPFTFTKLSLKYEWRFVWLILLGLCPLACALVKTVLSLVLLIELFCFGIKELRNVRWMSYHLNTHVGRHVNHPSSPTTQKEKKEIPKTSFFFPRKKKILIFLLHSYLGPFTRARKTCCSLWWSRASFCDCVWRIHKNVWFSDVWKG